MFYRKITNFCVYRTITATKTSFADKKNYIENDNDICYLTVTAAIDSLSMAGSDYDAAHGDLGKIAM